MYSLICFFSWNIKCVYIIMSIPFPGLRLLMLTPLCMNPWDNIRDRMQRWLSLVDKLERKTIREETKPIKNGVALLLCV